MSGFFVTSGGQFLAPPSTVIGKVTATGGEGEPIRVELTGDPHVERRRGFRLIEGGADGQGEAGGPDATAG